MLCDPIHVPFGITTHVYLCRCEALLLLVVYIFLFKCKYLRRATDEILDSPFEHYFASCVSVFTCAILYVFISDACREECLLKEIVTRMLVVQ